MKKILALIFFVLFFTNTASIVLADCYEKFGSQCISIPDTACSSTNPDQFSTKSDCENTLAYKNNPQSFISNPALTGGLGNDYAQASSGQLAASYFILIWRSLFTIGALLLILYLVWGALEWMSAGGDTGQVEKARNKMTNAVIGLVILVSSFTIIAIISWIFFGSAFNILEATFPTAGQ